MRRKAKLPHWTLNYRNFKMRLQLNKRLSMNYKDKQRDKNKKYNQFLWRRKEFKKIAVFRFKNYNFK